MLCLPIFLAISAALVSLFGRNVVEFGVATFEGLLSISYVPPPPPPHRPTADDFAALFFAASVFNSSSLPPLPPFSETFFSKDGPSPMPSPASSTPAPSSWLSFLWELITHILILAARASLVTHRIGGLMEYILRERMQKLLDLEKLLREEQQDNLASDSFKTDLLGFLDLLTSKVDETATELLNAYTKIGDLQTELYETIGRIDQAGKEKHEVEAAATLLNLTIADMSRSIAGHDVGLKGITARLSAGATANAILEKQLKDSLATVESLRSEATHKAALAQTKIESLEGELDETRASAQTKIESLEVERDETSASLHDKIALIQGHADGLQTSLADKGRQVYVLGEEKKQLTKRLTQAYQPQLLQTPQTPMGGYTQHQAPPQPAFPQHPPTPNSQPPAQQHWQHQTQQQWPQQQPQQQHWPQQQHQQQHWQYPQQHWQQQPGQGRGAGYGGGPR